MTVVVPGVEDGKHKLMAGAQGLRWVGFRGTIAFRWRSRRGIQWAIWGSGSGELGMCVGFVVETQLWQRGRCG